MWGLSDAEFDKLFRRIRETHKIVKIDGKYIQRKLLEYPAIKNRKIREGKIRGRFITPRRAWHLIKSGFVERVVKEIGARYDRRQGRIIFYRKTPYYRDICSVPISFEIVTRKVVPRGFKYEKWRELTPRGRRLKRELKRIESKYRLTPLDRAYMQWLRREIEKETRIKEYIVKRRQGKIVERRPVKRIKMRVWRDAKGRIVTQERIRSRLLDEFTEREHSS